MKTFKVWNIEWDTDFETPPAALPSECVISTNDCDREPEDVIADALSDQHGWCVFGFDFEER